LNDGNVVRLNPAYEGQLGDTSIGVSFNSQHCLVDQAFGGCYPYRELMWFVTRALERLHFDRRS
jgi:hypothetical protein